MFRDRRKDGSTVITSGLTISEIADVIYPVGAIYMSIDDTNPGSIFGGTWVAWGAGRVPVGYNDGDSDFDTVEETGGSKTHSHGLENSSTGARIRLAADNGVWATTKTMPVRASTRSVTVSGNAANTGNTSVGVVIEGTSDESSSLQPYVVCHMWKRTA